MPYGLSSYHMWVHCTQSLEITGLGVGLGALWYVGSQFLHQGLNLGPLHGKVDS